jgi:hypothetical protein
MTFAATSQVDKGEGLYQQQPVNPAHTPHP